NDSKVDLIDILTKNDLLIANQIVKKLNIKPNFS